jgi:chemotaxis protein MotB
MADGKEASIIIKKIKKGGHAGHHGGAWKVAYADFVTAMMAFFLLLWLLQATAQSQKEGIAEYFTPTTGIRDAAGIGFKGGKTNTIEGVKMSETSPPSILVGRMPQGPTAQNSDHQAPLESTQDSSLYEKGGQNSHMPEKGGRDTKSQQVKPESAETQETETPNDAHVFEKAESDLRKAIEEDPNFHDFKDNIIVEQTPEGLKIDIIDDDKTPMFEARSAQLTQGGEKMLRLMADIIRQMPNRISITGHTEATNYADPSGLYTNWELTADRANAARRFLMTTNMEPTRVAKVTGRADQELLDLKQPTSSRNRRVTIILLRNSYLKTLDSQAAAPQPLLTVPKATDKFTEIPKPAAPKPAAPATPAPKKPAGTPVTHAEKTNTKTLSTDFKMPDELRHSMGGASGGGDSGVPQSLFNPPAPPQPAPPAPPPKPAPKPVLKPAPQPAAPASDLGPISGNGTAISSEFKMPDALRRSMQTPTPGGPEGSGASTGGKANDGLNALPSGLIQTEGN